MLNRTAALVVAICLSSALSSIARSAPVDANVYIKTLICPAETANYQRFSTAPAVFLDSADRPVHSEIKGAGDERSLSLHVKPGFHSLLIVSDYGESKITADVLSGHSRTFVVVLCNSLMHNDSYRSLSVEGFTEGLAAFVSTSGGAQAATAPILSDSGVGYAVGLTKGDSLLTIVYPSGDACTYALPTDDDWKHQHLRYRLDWSALSIRSDLAICAALIAF